MFKEDFSRFFLFGLMFISATIVNAQNFTQQELAGSYTAGHEFFEGTITLKENGDFVIESAGCTDSFFESGNYFLESGLIVINTQKATRKSHSDETEINLLEPANKDKSEEYPRIQKFLPIRWDDRIYLIEPDGVKEFVNAINLGVEPRKSKTSRLYLGTFYLRAEEVRGTYPLLLKTVTGFPILPNDWNSYLLKKAVSAKVTAIEKVEKGAIATIDKGKEHGLKVGMQLITENQEPSLWSGAEVTEVGNKFSKVKVYDGVKVGDVLNSKFTITKENEFLYY